jgi:hypothetical protein
MRIRAPPSHPPGTPRKGRDGERGLALPTAGPRVARAGPVGRAVDDDLLPPVREGAEVTAPQRIQRKRTKGWRMPAGAVYVGRPSRWGNPFRIGETYPFLRGGVTVRDAEQAVKFFADWVEDIRYWDAEEERFGAPITALRGHDLACWCRPEWPCHADVLLELANGALS